MATSSAAAGELVAFDLGPATTTTNGFHESAPEQHALEHSLCLNGGGGGSGDSLNCDNNNNELGTKILGSLDTPEIPKVAKTTAALKDHHNHQLHVSGGDHSIDSGVAGGDSDEADCGVPASADVDVVVPPLVQPISKSVGGASSSSGRSSVVGSGDELSPAEKMLQDQFFMNGGGGRMDGDDDGDNDQDDGSSPHLSLGEFLEDDGASPHGKGFVQDCPICQ